MSCPGRQGTQEQPTALRPPVLTGCTCNYMRSLRSCLSRFAWVLNLSPLPESDLDNPPKLTAGDTGRLGPCPGTSPPPAASSSLASATAASRSSLPTNASTSSSPLPPPSPPHPRTPLHRHPPHRKPAHRLVPNLPSQLLLPDLLHVPVQLLPELALPQPLIRRAPPPPALARDEGLLDVERGEVLLARVAAGAESGVEEAEEDDEGANGDAGGDGCAGELAGGGGWWGGRRGEATKEGQRNRILCKLLLRFQWREVDSQS